MKGKINTHRGMICGCESCVKLKGGVTSVMMGTREMLEAHRNPKTAKKLINEIMEHRDVQLWNILMRVYTADQHSVKLRDKRIKEAISHIRELYE